MAQHSTTPMPAQEQTVLKAAYAAFHAAVDPHNDWANKKLASAIVSALDVGWSQRSLAEGLGITRDRVGKLSRWDSAPRIKIEPYAPRKAFPARAAAAFRRLEDEVNLRRILTERTFTATVRAAAAAGWPYPRLGAILGLTGERVRQVAEMDLSTYGIDVPTFTAYVRPVKDPAPVPEVQSLTAEEAAQLRALADTARTATKAIGKRLGPAPTKAELQALEASLKARRASEELSALIIAAKNRKISWPDLDAACGYSPGGARVRATRHGYGKTWPSLTPYTPTTPDAYDRAGLPRALSSVPDGA